MLPEVLLTLFLVLLNGFFVAAEFAIVKVRYSQIQIKALEGNAFARKSQHIIKNLDTYLSATQLGITLASLGLGWVGEPIISKLIAAFLMYFDIKLSPEMLHTVSLPIAFLTITILHIVFGELVPKSIAIRKPESTTLFIAYPLSWFFTLLKPFIWVMNATSNAFLSLIGIKPVGEHEIHSTDELRLLVEQSKDGGVIEAENYEIIKNAFDFTDHNAKQIMVPRQEIFALDADLPEKEIVEGILENGYSRIPIYKGSIDNIIGIVYAKDVLKAHYKNADFKIESILNQAFYAIETKRISEILADFQKMHIHMAVVMDEFGGTQGIITMEDILEELVGEIQDENDDERPIVESKEENTYLVQATYSLEDINEFLPHPLLLSDNYNTLSGLLLYHSNRVPRINERLVIENYEMMVTKIQQRTIQVVQLKPIDN
jgi:CBS domain containing-hemolysin-like protein